MVKELDAYRGFAIDAAPHHVDHRQRAAPVNLLLRDQADPLEVEDVGRQLVRQRSQTRLDGQQSRRHLAPL